MTKPPTAPYPPDIAADAQPQRAELTDLVDAIVTGGDWANERAERWSARRVELHECRLTGVDLAQAAISDALFDDCRIDLAGIRHAAFERVVFRDCRMGDCDLYGSTLKDVLFERCELREATFSTCTVERVEFRGCDLAGARGADALRGARMLWPDVVENAALFAVALGIEIIED